MPCVRPGGRTAACCCAPPAKPQNAQTVRASAECAIDVFGENRVQELTEKLAAGAYGAKPVHMIGHLQTNKVKYVVGHASLIHSVDSVCALWTPLKKSPPTGCSAGHSAGGEHRRRGK